MSWRSASTSTSRPASRAASLVTGPIETTRAPRGKRSPSASTRLAHGRGGGEGDVVGALGRLDRLRVGLLADRLVEGDDVDLGAALAQRVGEHVAGLGGAGDEHAAALDLDLGERLDQRLGDEALGDDVGGDPVLGEGARRCRGRSRRRSRRRARGRRGPRAGQRLEQQPDAVGAGQADQRVGRRSRRPRRRTSSLSIRGSIRIAGSSTTSAPSAAQRRGEAARLGAGAGDDDAAAVQRAALEPGERLAPRGDRADDDQRRRARCRSRSTASAIVPSVAVDRALARPACRARPPPPARRRRARRRSAPPRSRPAA